MPGMTWDSEADQKLMMAIIAIHSITIDFAAVAEHMGNVCTPRAVQERLKKIKKLGAGSGEATSTPTTPKGKRGNKATPSAKSERQNGKAIQAAKVDDSDTNTDLLTDLGSDIDNFPDIKEEEEAEDDALKTPDGKTKASKAKAKATPKAKSQAKPEPKPAKAAAASSSSSGSATKSKKATTSKASGNASPVKANQSTKRKRGDDDENEDENGGVKAAKHEDD